MEVKFEDNIGSKDSISCIKYLFRMICLFVVMALICTEIKKYLDNNDKTVLSFTQLHKSPDDKYPTYTICFQPRAAKVIKEGKLFKKGYLEDRFGLARNDYVLQLLGEEQVEYTPHLLKDIKFEKASLGIPELFQRYKLTSTDDTTSGDVNCSNVGSTNPSRNQHDIKMGNCPFYRSYQDPTRVCFTRKDMSNHLRVPIASEEVDVAKMKFFYFKLYIHSQNQGMRNFFKKFDSKKLFKQSINTGEVARVTVILSGINTLRKRPDSKNNCTLDSGDDERIFESTIKRFGCLPPYWKMFSPLATKMVVECNNKSELFGAWRNISKAKFLHGNASVDGKSLRDQIVQSFPSPCNETFFTIAIKRANLRKEAMDQGLSKKHTHEMKETMPIQLRFKYSDENYLEIKNVRDFEVATLLANVGGLIGVFLGYSLVHATKLFDIPWNKIVL